MQSAASSTHEKSLDDQYASLVALSLDLIQSYNEIIDSLDTHCETFFKKRKIEDKTTRVFLKQMLAGYKRYFRFNKVFTDALFRVSSASTNRSSQDLYHIMLYLLIFRYDDLPRDELAGFLKSQDAVKMNVFLDFLFDTDGLRQEVYNEWCLVYEDNYIESVLDGLDRKRDELAKTLSSIIEKAVGKSSATETKLSSKLSTFKKEEPKKFEPTKPEPFNLSQAKPRALPEPMKVERKVKANPIPKEMYKTSLKEMEEERLKKREANKKQTEEDHKKLVKPFDLQTHTRPMQIEKLIEEREKEAKQHLQAIVRREVPDYPEVDIKLNAAAILKEAQAIEMKRKQVESEAMESELNRRDGKDFEVWRERGKREDKEEEIKKQMQRKIEMELAHEQAKRAVLNQEDAKRLNADKLKQEKQVHQKRRESMRKKDEVRKVEIKKEIYGTRDNVVKVKEKIVKVKQEAVEGQKEKLKVEIELKRLEEKKQQEIRDQLILKIRELDRKVIRKPKDYDPAEQKSNGLLEEMSLVELQQRHQDMKVEFKRQEEERREKIRLEKTEKQESLEQMKELIEGARQHRRLNNQAQREKKKVKEQARDQRKHQEHEKAVVEAYSEITSKKDRLKQEYDEVKRLEKDIRLKKQYMQADQSKVEELAWKSLEEGAEREIRTRQNAKLIEQEKIESVKLKERKLIAESALKEFQHTIDRQREYNSRQHQEEIDKEVLTRMLRQSQQETVNSIKEFKQGHSKNVEELKPYEAKITMLSRTGQIVSGNTFNTHT